MSLEELLQHAADFAKTVFEGWNDVSFLKRGALWTLREDTIAHPAWNLVWEAIIESDFIQPQCFKQKIIEKGIKWYEGHTDHEMNSYVLQKYLDRGERRAAVATEINEFLRNCDTISANWLDKFLGYGRSTQFDNSNTALIGRALSWLTCDQNLGNIKWPAMWVGLFKLNVDKKMLLNVGEIWLARSEYENRAWASTWLKVAPEIEANTQFLERACAWLENNPPGKHQKSAEVLRKALQISQNNPAVQSRLRLLAQNWTAFTGVK